LRFLIPLLALVLTNQVQGAAPQPLVPKVREVVQPEIERHLADAEKATQAELAKADSIRALFKPALRQRAVKDHWGALTELEKRGLDLAASCASGLKALPEVVRGLDHFLDKPAAGKLIAIERGTLVTLDDHLLYITKVLDAAERLRNEAIAKLSKEDRAFMFSQPVKLIREFSPQVRLNEKTRPLLRDDLAFCTHWEQTINGPTFAASIQTFLQLADPTYLNDLKAAMEKTRPMVGPAPEGMTGEFLAVRETRHGLIVLSGGKQNSYKLNQPVAFLADVGGDDTYKRTVASSFDVSHPFGMVVDFAGDDIYEPSELGLATGRLGCGCLIDRTGNDTYKAAAGSGGCAFAGVGILIDEDGRDTYTGTRFTLGAAVAGTGLLLDLKGNDTYTASGYSLGLSGPCGVGAIIDLAGDDHYRCGFDYASGYNSTDAPTAKPGDPGFQYDAFGLGVGLGRRVYPFSDEGDKYNLAGGVGLWIDAAGNDRSESSNFSQACAYFFGIGLKMDFEGNDHHNAGRYGLAGGAHYGMGLFLDYDGDDTYAPVGPVYTIGCAWDRSVFLLADGRGDDTYDLTKSSGGGRGDRGGWGVFADLQGRDKYRVRGTPGAASEKGVGVFFDGAGVDEYPKPGGSLLPANGVSRRDSNGGLFHDREDK
jgi:hypothetical protein